MRAGKLSVMVCLPLLAATVLPNLKADEWNEKSIVTFSGPVEIPGRVLSAGTYVFKLLDSDSNRNIVQIFNKDETKLYATILAIPDYRLKPTGKPVITFEERAAGAPEAIRAWFYPGDEYGSQFVYPKPKAVELAKASNQHVLSMPAAMAPNITKPAKSVKEPHVAQMKQAPVNAVKPSGEEVEIAEVILAPPPKVAAAPQQQLPQTASSLPLFALLGLLAIGGSAVLHIAAARAR